jgi:predicted nucleic acid-binding protein
VKSGLPSTPVRRYVLDANALISFLEGRPAAPKVRRLIEEAGRSDSPLLLSAVNWGEVFYVSWRLHGEGLAREIEFKLRRLPILVVAADQERATRAAALKHKHNLSYADSFAAELAIDYKAWLVTSDPEFAKLGKLISLCALPRHDK